MSSVQLIGFDASGNVLAWANRTSNAGDTWRCHTAGLDQGDVVAASKPAATMWLRERGATRVVGVSEMIAGHYTVIA